MEKAGTWITKAAQKSNVLVLQKRQQKMQKKKNNNLKLVADAVVDFWFNIT